ncbi:MAG: VCBS repeat-containing protein [Veillonellaceae bacterium]|nr:VCBS repeat-containing protein [Veillonellaceae bacterium]
MKGLTPLLVLLALPAAVPADSSTQDFWNGGPGVPGPVSYWSNSFAGCDSIEYGHPYIVELVISNVFHWIHSTGPGADEMVIVDTDGDGDPDVVGVQATWARVSHWENLDGSGLNWARTIIADSLQSTWSIDAVDMDEDGDWDLVVSTFDGPRWLENTSGGDWIEHEIGALEYIWSIRAGDIDGDGDSDVTCGRSGTDGLILWYENFDGAGGIWIEHQVSDDYNFTYCIRICDLDNDQDSDILIGKGTVSKIVWFENLDGLGGAWQPHLVCDEVHGGYQGFPLFGLEAADMDDDGDNDVLAAASDPYTVTGMVIWVENADGVGETWVKHSIDNNLSGAFSVDCADLDGDGDMDAMACSGGEWGERLVAWYENVTGNALNWHRHELDSSIWWAADVMGYDLDLDGDMDAVYSDGVAGVRWYEFSRATSGWLESSILDPPGGSQEQWTDLSWEATTPAGTGLTFQVRASNDPGDMGEWSAEMAAPGSLAPYLPDPAWYFQYRVNLSTADPPLTPILDKVTVLYDLMGTPGGGESSGPSLRILSGNPSPGAVTLDVYLPEAGQADLRIFDIAGRVVAHPLSGQIEAGHHQLTVTDLPSGCYQAVMITGGCSTEAELVILTR